MFKNMTIKKKLACYIISALKRAIEALSRESEQVSSVSSQVSAASQSLAEGVTEQAAGPEETSSRLEAGKDFTAVSEEVCNLVMRFPEAAENTTNLIEETSAASREQGQGIEQVKSAESRMNKVTQQNAAGVSKALSSQAAERNKIVVSYRQD